MRIYLIVVVVFGIFGTSTVVRSQASFYLFHNGSGRCYYNGGSLGGNLYLDIPEDLEPVQPCEKCADIFGTNSIAACYLAPCDGMLCFEDEYRLSEKEVDRCGFEGSLQLDCNECDTPCLTTCSITASVYTVKEVEFVECGFDLTAVGYTTSTLCSGNIADAYCDNAEAEGRTCYVAKFSRDDDLEPTPALQVENCAPIFARVNDEYDYWACPMDSPVSGRVEIYNTPYCEDFAKNYGDPISDGYDGDTLDGTNDGSKLSDLFSSLILLLFSTLLLMLVL